MLHRLERHAGYPATHVSALQAVRYIGQPGFKPATRTSYYSLLLAWFTWLEEEEGTPNPFSGLRRACATTATLRTPPHHNRPVAETGSALPSRKTRAMVLIGGVRGPEGPRDCQDQGRGSGHGRDLH